MKDRQADRHRHRPAAALTALRRPRRAAADNLWALLPPTFVDQRAAAENLSAMPLLQHSCLRCVTVTFALV